MSIDHLAILHQEMPQLFEPRSLPPSWDEDLIIVPLEDPEVFTSDFQVAPNETTELENIEPVESEVPERDDAPPPLLPAIAELLGGHAGAPQSYSNSSFAPPPDCLAFYLPFHYYHPEWWGVYLLYEGVEWLARDIVRRTGGVVTRLQAMQASRLFLYYHEAFHHKTECFATRLELAHRQPLYRIGFEQLYQRTYLTADCLEEALANASALSQSRKRHRSGPIDTALEDYVLSSPPGYNRGAAVRRKFVSHRNRFAELNVGASLGHLPRAAPEVWKTTPYMFNGISNIKGRVNYVIPKSSPLAARLPFRPLLSPGKLIRKLKDKVGLQFGRHGKRHDVYVTRNGNSVAIPRHPKDLRDGLIRSILRECGLDISLEQFLRL